ncbi:type 1 glutamine amidotransferase domain-containing protein [Sediminivirga luteola]|jgi:protease I|uniref:type 1 glutamine amidotransferase domain-containing protein n=1 Tax=Sediminivirga luteola TaxID=1774748 RepID=UPI001F55CFAE|nr:type 1 glutamine amidotransferase domain-containing protein [Sediminivirga luteola]MCI2266778.1 type 1 glutamine amidotransferase [Sediminivirga luteola]
MATLNGKTIAFLASKGVEQVELTHPWQALRDAGATTVLVAPDEDQVHALNNDWDRGDSFPVDKPVAEAQAADYDALVLPGGTLNADGLRINEDAVAFVRSFFEQGKTVAAICHAPWILIDAGQAEGRRLTSYTSLEPDLKNAGARWEDTEVVVDGNLITSRNPGDLDAFSGALIDALS